MSKKSLVSVIKILSFWRHNFNVNVKCNYFRNFTLLPVNSFQLSIMSQRSIASYFKKSPSLSEKNIEDNGKSSKRHSKKNGDTKVSALGDETNLFTKKGRKRQRIESSSDDGESSSKSPVKSGCESPVKSPADKSNLSPKSPVSNVNDAAPTKMISPHNSLNTNKRNDNVKKKKLCSSPNTENMLKPEVNSDVKTKPTSWFITEKVKEETTNGTVADEDYNPAKSKYHPINDACWAKGQAIPYLALAKTLEAIEATSARLKMVEILSNYFRSVIALTPEDLLPSIYMCLNQLAPAYHSLELGVAETYLMKAIGQCTGRSLAQMRTAAARDGDLGRVAQAARAQQRTMLRPPPLRARNVFAALKDIAHITGQASVNKKINKIQSLFVACRQSESRYLIRSLEGKLRIGLAEQSVLQALALAVTMTPPDPEGVKVLDASKGLSAEEFKARVSETALIVKRTYCECPDYGRVVPALLAHGATSLPAHCRLTPGTPLKPMLAHPTKSVHEIFDRFEDEEFTCEWKYDGERAQIHVPAGATGAAGDAPDFSNAAIFSRNQENNTSKYPDVLQRLPALLKPSVRSCVLDCEVVAYDTRTQQILPFQILSTRKRKDASRSELLVQVCVFVFDLLFLNGDALVHKALHARRALLREHFQELQGEWQFATSKDCSTIEEVQLFLDEAVKGSCEGLMVKTLHGDHAKYDIARRSRNWLKLKKDYLDGVGDTIDAVVIGAYRGRGKRAGIFGGFLLACYDPDMEEYQSLCKIGTGFTDEDLQTLTATLQEHVIDGPKSYYRYDAMHAADVWVSAASVWEVRGADVTLSSAHRAARSLLHPDKGVSLRFPRFVRVRSDKTPEQATSARQVADMYLAQDQVRNSAAANTTADDDFY